MSDSKAQALADQFKILNDSMIAFSNSCSDREWEVKIKGEDWPTGAVVHHVAMGHYSVIGLIKRATRGQDLPDASSVNIDELNASQLNDGLNFTKDMAVTALTNNGGKIIDFMLTLSDEQIDTVHHFSLWGIDVSIGQLFENVYLKSAADHLKSMKTSLNK